MKQDEKNQEGLGLIDVALDTLYRCVGVFTSLAVLAAVVFGLFFKVFTVSGSSMENTLMNGDVIVTYTFIPNFKNGDIAVFFSDVEGGSFIVKRIIASQGQRVELDYDGSFVTVDGQRLKEHYAHGSLSGSKDPGSVHECIVPKRSFFVLGDNRFVSFDSRKKRIGCLDERFAVGRVVFKLPARKTN